MNLSDAVRRKYELLGALMDNPWQLALRREYRAVVKLQMELLEAWQDDKGSGWLGVCKKCEKGDTYLLRYSPETKMRAKKVPESEVRCTYCKAHHVTWGGYAVGAV